MSKLELKQIPIHQLTRNPYQPRYEFQQQGLEELAESIKSSGLIQPLIVRQLGPDSYELVAGERRWRAAQLAGLHEITCVIKPYTDEQSAQIALIENIQRIDLNPIEESQAYQRLIDEFAYLHDELATIVGKSRTKITNSLRLLKLDERVQQDIIAGNISEGHGKVLASLPTSAQYRLAQHSITNNWSVRQLERIAKKAEGNIAPQTKSLDSNIEALEQQLSEHFSCKVTIEFTKTHKGVLKFDFHNLEILEGLLEKFGVDVN